MIRTLLLAAFVAMAFCQAAVDQQEWYGPRMGESPFCDSRCLPSGTWKFRRDWRDLESKVEDKYIFFGDGPEAWWDRGCGSAINEFFIAHDDSMDTNELNFLLSCKPAFLYFFELDLDYKHKQGRLITELYLKDSYMITDDSWSNFINDYFLSDDDSDVDVRTNPWTLIRSFPSLQGATRYSSFNGDVSIKQTFVANYERNFCTFVGSVTPIVETDLCDFTDDYDSDYDTDEIKYITREFCQWVLGDFGEHRFDLACGVTDDADDCDGITVVSDSRRRVGGALRPMKRLQEVVLGARMGGSVKEATPEEFAQIQKKLGRDAGQYDPSQQAIPGFGPAGTDTDPTFWSTPWSDATFYYVPYTSSITAPYCAYRQDS